MDFDWQCYFELIKLTKFFTRKKKNTPVHLRWSWHWFSLTENFWTWLSETRSRGGARRAAQIFSLKNDRNLKFLLAPGLGKSEAQTYGLRPPPLASEMPRGPAWTLKIVPWAGGVGSWWLIGEKVVNVLSFDSNLKEKNRKAKIENKWTGLNFVNSIDSTDFLWISFPIQLAARWFITIELLYRIIR